MTAVGTRSSDPYACDKRWQSPLRSGCAYLRVRGAREGKATCVTLQYTETLPANQCSPVNVLDLGQVYYQVLPWGRRKKGPEVWAERHRFAFPSREGQFHPLCNPQMVLVIAFLCWFTQFSLTPLLSQRVTAWSWIFFHTASTPLRPVPSHVLIHSQVL